jgi:hypothetical protein
VLAEFFGLTNYLLNKRDVGRFDNMVVETGRFDPGLIFGASKARECDCYWTSAAVPARTGASILCAFRRSARARSQA